MGQLLAETMTFEGLLVGIWTEPRPNRCETVCILTIAARSPSRAPERVVTSELMGRETMLHACMNNRLPLRFDVKQDGQEWRLRSVEAVPAVPAEPTQTEFDAKPSDVFRYQATVKQNQFDPRPGVMGEWTLWLEDLTDPAMPDLFVTTESAIVRWLNEQPMVGMLNRRVNVEARSAGAGCYRLTGLSWCDEPSEHAPAGLGTTRTATAAGPIKEGQLVVFRAGRELPAIDPGVIVLPAGTEVKMVVLEPKPSPLDPFKALIEAVLLPALVESVKALWAEMVPHGTLSWDMASRDSCGIEGPWLVVTLRQGEWKTVKWIWTVGGEQALSRAEVRLTSAVEALGKHRLSTWRPGR